MNVNGEIMRGINDNLMKNSDLKVIAGLKDLTLLDMFALINTVKMRDKL
ncbi:MAG: hypothetical protein LLF98_10390 [Clostridium sp.]|nr:hypothetical protein [Clostridium sp.]MCE5221646.1 hypothetical protein [Clostridium sp.]